MVILYIENNVMTILGKQRHTPASLVGGPPLFIAVYPLIRVSVYTVSDDLCVYRMLCMSM